MSEKPSRFYHGSPNRDIEIFEPKVSLGSGEKYGALVYASPDLAISSIFLSKVAGTWSAGRFGDVPYVEIPMPRDEFVKNDNGGCIYVLPPDTFEMDESRGLGKKEWASSTAVKPIEKIDYPSALGAMIDNGIQVYFLTKEQYEETKTAPDKGRSLLRSLTSENQNRGVGVREI